MNSMEDVVYASCIGVYLYKHMKICHLITRMIVGGAQENTLFTVRGHLENGHEAILLTGPTSGLEGKLLQEQRVPGLCVEIVDSLTREIVPGKDWVAYKQLRRYFEANEFDVVHTHSSKAGVIGRIAARKAGVPVVVHTVHGQSFHPYQSGLKNDLYIRVEKFAAKYCDRIFAVADAMIDQCVDAGIAPRTKYRTVYSGMDLEPYLNSETDVELLKSLEIPQGVPVVGKIARLFELKGHEFLIEAAQDVIDEIGDVRFLIIGDGILRSKLESTIRARGLMKYFIFVGLVSPDEIPRYVSIMNCLVHLSLREGLPRTVVQALAGGKPAIGYNLDGTPEVIKDKEFGFVCPPESTLAVATAIVRLLKNPEMAQKMGMAGRDFVKEHWDWRRMVTILEHEYEGLTTDGGV